MAPLPSLSASARSRAPTRQVHLDVGAGCERHGAPAPSNGIQLTTGPSVATAHASGGHAERFVHKLVPANAWRSDLLTAARTDSRGCDVPGLTAALPKQSNCP